MRALLAEGGGVRAAFAAGVLDAMLEEDEPYDIVAGTSAGALLAAAYLAGQKGRSLRVLRDPACRAAFGRITDFLRGGDLVDLELLHETANRLEALDTEAVMMHPARFLLTVTDVDTGLGHVLEPSHEELTSALKATSALPIAVRSPISVRGMTCLDGGIAIPLPVQPIIDLGATELVVVRTRLATYRNNGTSGRLAAPWFERKQPALAEALRRRGDVYNAMVDLLEHPPKGVAVQQIHPRRAPACRRTGGSDVDIVRDHLMGVDAGQVWRSQRRVSAQSRTRL